MRRLNYKVTGLIFFFLLVISSPSFAQKVAPVQALQKYAITSPGEKIFAHLSQTDLITGELLWFSLFVTDAGKHLPSILSKVAYVELIDRDNKILLQDKILLENGSGFGSFYLPASIVTGGYLFRAYTSWMKNSAPEFFFNKEVQIINTLRSPDLPSGSSISNVYHAAFFPEGGSLVQGLPSRVAFHIKDQFGNGVEAKGFLLSGSDTILIFKTTRLGMGDFRFTPTGGRKYTAVFNLNSNQSLKTDLPEVLENGMVLTVKYLANENIRVSVRSSPGFQVNRLEGILHCRNTIISEVNLVLIADSASIDIERKNLKSGINHLTFFDPSGNPIVERLIFSHPSPYSFELKTGQPVYNIRSRASLEWSNLPDSIARLSVTVVKADSIAEQSEIRSYLYLSSDLKGKVELPEYYFSSAPEVEHHADLLMLTHGWRRFNWSGLSAYKTHHLPELKSHLVTARLLDGRGEPVPGKTAFLSSPGKSIRLYTARSDEDGRLYFEVKPGQLGGKLFIQPDKNDSLVRAVAESPFSSQFMRWMPRAMKLYPSQIRELSQRSVDMQVQDIFREQETFYSRPAPSSDTIPFYGKPDERYNLDDFVRFPSMEEVMREFVKGVWVRKREGSFKLFVLDKDVNRMFNQPPVLLLDGVPIANADKLFEIDALKIKRIDVVARKYYTGPLVSEGLISLVSYDGKMAGLEPDSNTAVIDLTSLEGKRIFNQTAYETIDQRSDRKPDRRRVLYFNHHLTLSAGSGKTFYYTSDTEGKFFVIANGLTSGGIPFSALTSFVVSR